MHIYTMSGDHTDVLTKVAEAIAEFNHDAALVLSK
jgi:hypothetical protein